MSDRRARAGARRPAEPLSDAAAGPGAEDVLAIGEYRPMGSAVLTDGERWPTLTPDGARRLRELRQHPFAPAWTHAAGDRLDAAATARVQQPLPLDGWIETHLETARGLLAYRRLDPLPTALADFPLVSRDDLVRDVAAYVPLDADLTRLVHGSSSGSTGHALQIPDDVEDTARTLHLLRRIAAGTGVSWDPDPARMALMNVVFQRQAFTYAGVLSSFGQASMARVNAHPDAWADGADQRDRFLAAQAPQVISGDPLSLVALASASSAALHPLAVFSSAMHLEPAARRFLEERFAAPVFDVYGLHETRPIAVRADDGPFLVLRRRVHVEVVGPSGDPVPDGVRGEIVVTCGENPLLPLVRYRTGDHGSLRRDERGVRIHGLEARDAVVFARADGREFACVDVTQQLQRHGAVGWTVTQHAGGVDALVALADASREQDVREALAMLFGTRVGLRFVDGLAALGPGKPRRYARRPADG